MSNRSLIEIANSLFVNNKGLLAIDESESSCNKRFSALGIPETIEMRRLWRELIITTPQLGKCISGIILCDETIRQQQKDGTPFIDVIKNAGIIPGIKVDIGFTGMAGFPEEKITQGLDGLDARLINYYETGARFAKWRAVINLGEGLPSKGCILANAHALARYAASCQAAGIVPVIEPEVLMEGEHTMERCREITEEVLHAVFEQLYKQNIILVGIILKPNMIVSGLTCTKQPTIEEVANATVQSFMRVVPAAVPGIAFLSGGQPGTLATERLNAMNRSFKPQMPWALSFSFSRAIQQEALKIWCGKEDNIKAAQDELFHRAECNWFANSGTYHT
jgi:fructose-bisphosphate aldolase class I